MWKCKKGYRSWQDSNLQSPDPKSGALSIRPHDPSYLWIPNSTECLWDVSNAIATTQCSVTIECGGVWSVQYITGLFGREHCVALSLHNCRHQRIFYFGRTTGPMAQRIRHLTTNQGIAGSNPARVKFFVWFSIPFFLTSIWWRTQLGHNLSSQNA